MGTGPGPPTASLSVKTGAVISHNAALAHPSTPLTSLPGPRLDVVGELLTLPTITVPAALQQPQSIDAEILQHIAMELPVAPSSPRCVEDAHVQGMQQDIQQPAMLTSEAREDDDVPQATIGPEVYRAASLLQELVLEPEALCEVLPPTGMDVARSSLEEGLGANIQGCEAGSNGSVTHRHMNGMPASNAKSQLPSQLPSADNVPHLSLVLSATDLAKVGCVKDGTTNRHGHSATVARPDLLTMKTLIAYTSVACHAQRVHGRIASCRRLQTYPLRRGRGKGGTPTQWKGPRLGPSAQLCRAPCQGGGHALQAVQAGCGLQTGFSSTTLL